MKRLDFTSIAVAAVVGALVLFVLVRSRNAALLGAFVGAVVQIGVRLIGVS
jgi:hypothetical protein